MAKIEINRRLYWINANCRDYQDKLTGVYIGFLLIIEMAKIEINRRLYWIYANCRDYQDKINRRLYWIFANYRDGQKRN